MPQFGCGDIHSSVQNDRGIRLKQQQLEEGLGLQGWWERGDPKERVCWLEVLQTYIRGEEIFQLGRVSWKWSSVAEAEIVRGGGQAHRTRPKRWPHGRGEAGNMAPESVDIFLKKTELVRSFFP